LARDRGKSPLVESRELFRDSSDPNSFQGCKRDLESVPLSSLTMSKSTSAVSSPTLSPFPFSSLPKRVQNPCETGRKIPIQLQACNCHRGEDQVLNFKASQICISKFDEASQRREKNQRWKVFRVQMLHSETRKASQLVSYVP
jgi:hypothetical protein